MLLLLGNLLLMSSGIHMAWGLWQIGIQPTWALCLSQPVYQFILCSWFLTAIVGIIVGSIILNIWKKAKIYVILPGLRNILILKIKFSFAEHLWSVVGDKWYSIHCVVQRLYGYIIWSLDRWFCSRHIVREYCLALCRKFCSANAWSYRL